eukprot:CAMPEP_0117756372 /NCGR_PEP_ID=MMETSP0947-20121206/14036_1 /TAXON_ID=44440 /ORGANISM="Chattonella subsalsa, Strain CCMP2191" /LENGTH=126 /DNA_ID=CAMNT_0005575941 /DNA_START=199 /DNA_END=579 /DNA_ORIENTATION=+
MEEFQFGSIKFKAWDLGGHQTVRYLWDDFSADSQGVIFMIDSADSERLAEAKEELRSLLLEPALECAPIVVLLNKIDLMDAMSAEEIRKELEWEEITKDNLIQCFQASVLQEIGYPEALQWLSRNL